MRHQKTYKHSLATHSSTLQPFEFYKYITLHSVEPVAYIIVSDLKTVFNKYNKQYNNNFDNYVFVSE